MSGVLHTSSYYAVHGVNTELTKKTFSSSGSIGNLKAREEAFYKEFGVNNYKEFQKKISELFVNNNDIEVLNRFLPENLSSKLQRFATSTGSLEGEEITLIINTSKVKDASKRTSQEFISTLQKTGNNNIKIKAQGDSSNLIQISCKFNPTNIKTILNGLVKDRHFLIGSSNMERANILIKELTDANTGAIEIFLGGEENLGNQEFKFVEPSIPNFPWGVKKDDIELAAKNKDSHLYKELKAAAQTIKNFIFNELGAGASQDLKRAMLLVWQAEGFYGKIEEPLNFFKGTTSSNFISAVQGNLGEFYSAVLFQYINIKLNGNYSKVSKILGDSIRNNEKLRTDLQVFQKFGIQIKHFNIIKTAQGSSFINDISTTIHPIDFDKYGNGIFSLSDFLANYYFNTTFQQEAQGEFDNLIKSLGDFLGELMNMAMNDSVVTDVVTFYYIGGRYLVPGSAILEASRKLDLENSIRITSAYKGLPDIAYEMPFLMQGERRPLFVEYWKKSGNNWNPTGKNRSVYHKLISKDISIRTSFNYWEELQNFSLL